MKPIIIFGDGTQGQLARWYLGAHSVNTVAALVNDDTVGDYSPKDCDMFVCLSYRDVNRNRAKKYYEMLERGFTLISFVSPYSCIFTSHIGDNCFIWENQTIQPFSKIGKDVTLCCSNHIGHHSTIGNHVFLTSHVCVSGHCVIGDYCFLGVNSSIIDGVNIAEGCVIGAGATVTRDTEPWGVYIGTPAKRIGDSRESKYFTNTNYSAKGNREQK